jgi:acyl-CoA reductase-like NAD-dependent aldehyde dehydrogenase
MSLAEVDSDAEQGAARMRARFDAQRAAFRDESYPTLAVRLDRLSRLESVLLDRRDEIADAICADFGNRSRHETLIAEVFVTVSGIRYLRKHLKSFMKARGRHVALTFLPGRARVEPQPLGVVGVISPWNYPVQLALAPLATALAAGNRVMLKPSELTPRTSELLARLLSDTFADDLVATVSGGPEIGAAFSALPFDHLLYTGSTHVGRIVMQAAARNLTPVTLELGGKSPAVVHRDFDVERAANSIGPGKLFNAGQTCIAPDYVLVHRDRVDAFVQALQAKVATAYTSLVDNPDYTAIINERHHQRLVGYLDDARDKGARVLELNPAGESFDDAGTKLAPHLILDPTDDMVVMQDEIFGPLLPIVAVDSTDEAIAFINDRPRPLALYVFDDDRARVDDTLRRTHAGGVTVNDCLLHIAQDDLPFGGIGPSGIGAYHGREGFDTFSHLKAVFQQARLNGSALLHPPFGRRVERLLSWLL